MEKEVKLGSRGKTQAQAEQDYPNQLGRALYYTVSTVAHYARYKICLFPQTPQLTYTRTSDGGEDQIWCLVCGCWGLRPGRSPRRLLHRQLRRRRHWCGGFGACGSSGTWSLNTWSFCKRALIFWSLERRAKPASIFLIRNRLHKFIVLSFRWQR